MSKLKLEIKDIDNCPNGKLISLIGVLNVSTVDSASKEIKEIIEDGFCKIIFDLSELEYIGSIGLGEFVGYRKSCIREGGTVLIACANKDIMEIFKDSGFIKIFKFYNTVDEAIAEIASYTC